MKKIDIYLILVLLILMTACGRKTKKVYYDTGQIKEERIYEQRNDTTNFFVIYYYLNGQIHSKGYIKNGLRNGEWQEWYLDGSLKWTGEYDNNERKLQLPSSSPIIIFEDSVLRKNKQTYLKVNVDGIHPNDMVVACNNGIINVSDKKEIFDYMVTPKHQGKIKFIYFVKKDGKMMEIGKDSLNVLE
jgi:hypothetical protein